MWNSLPRRRRQGDECYLLTPTPIYQYPMIPQSHFAEKIQVFQRTKPPRRFTRCSGDFTMALRGRNGPRPVLGA